MVGYFESSVTVASQCPAGCYSCDSLTACTHCSTGYFMLISQLCASSCPAQFYADSLTSQCEVCPYDCETCESAGVCLTCAGGSTLTSAGRCSPQAGSFWGASGRRRLLTAGAVYSIQTCPGSCVHCLSTTTCLSCASSFFMRSDLFCYSSCPARYFQDATNRMCVACPYDCYTCSSTGQCLTCNSTTDFR
jgi:proprotein convertase subtilisin/kexin type 5